MVNLTGWRRGESQDALVTREWLVTNALGGYATGTIGGIATRRYHGVLIAALPAPLGRFVMLNHLEERVVVRGQTRPLSGDEALGGTIRFPDLTLLEEFRLERGLPVWIFNDDGVRITKRLVMPHLQNTTCITYELDAASEPARLRLRPAVHFRPHELDVTADFAHPYTTRVNGSRLEISADGLPSLRIEL
ncbi:MAG: glycogen debranching protein, partial [Acidobacteria bacterium]|nr:glycogen debranching protein [Acidobacteriota bacterium]